MIDKEIVSGKPHAQIARKFNVGELSVRGHAKNHLSKTLVRNEDARELLHSKSLLSEMTELVHKCKDILERNIGKRDNISLSAARELREIFSFFVRIKIDIEGVQKNDAQEHNRRQSEILKHLDCDELEYMSILMTKAGARYEGQPDPDPEKEDQILSDLHYMHGLQKNELSDDTADIRYRKNAIRRRFENQKNSNKIL
jgi:hypothetical protein